jgi:hypothetical protein
MPHSPSQREEQSTDDALWVADSPASAPRLRNMARSRGHRCVASAPAVTSLPSNGLVVHVNGYRFPLATVLFIVKAS